MANKQSPLFVVGIGASAGGLEALERFFANVTPHPDLAYVVIQHLSPDFKSMMPDILGRVTPLPLYSIQDGMVIEPNTIYLNVPRHDVLLENGRLLLSPSVKASTAPRPINRFFTSLSQEMGGNGIGVVLSGSGQDGAEGILDIHKAGGITLCQDMESALFSSMPKAAANQLPNPIIHAPDEMPDFITNYVLNPNLAPHGNVEDPLVGTDENALTFLISLLKRRFEIDFTRYKPYTLFRRLDARIELLGLKNLAEYGLMLKENIAEQNSLYRDLLIDVTAFFRDPAAFSYLEQKIVPELVAQKSDGETVRVWVAACATGEEAYSLGILIQEEIEKQERSLQLKIFATDAHHDSIAIASDGIYDEKKLDLVRDEFSSKYFTLIDTEQMLYQVSASLRSKIVFATHNLLENPHFSQLDMISCRNMLIYVDDDAQEDLLYRFHMGLKIGGILFLGPSEHLRQTVPDYDALNNQWRIFRKISNNSKPEVKDRDEVVNRLPKYMQQQAKLTGFKNWETRLLQELVQVGYVVDGQGSLKEVYGAGRNFLQFKTGRIALTLTNLLPDILAIPIRTGLQMAQEKGELVRFEAVDLGDDGFNPEIEEAFGRYCAIDIVPFQGANYDIGKSGKFYLISISKISTQPSSNDPAEIEMDSPPSHLSPPIEPSELSKISSLERELSFTRESLQSTIEEMQSTNEELQSANEELQSTNEELSSVNEELFTVNSEFQEQNQIYTQLNNDLRNMLSASHVMIILLDNNLNLRHVTPFAQEVFGILDSDIGRSILQFNMLRQIDTDTFYDWLQQALRGTVISKIGNANSGLHLSLKISPYLSQANAVDGLTLYFTDLTQDIEFLEKIYPNPPIFEKLSGDSPSMIIIRDLESHQIVFSGGALLEQLGLTSIAGVETFDQLLHPDDQTNLEHLDSEIKKLRGPEVIRRTHLLKSSSGEPVLCKASEGVYELSEQGELIQSITIITPLNDAGTQARLQG